MPLLFLPLLIVLALATSVALIPLSLVQRYGGTRLHLEDGRIP